MKHAGSPLVIRYIGVQRLCKGLGTSDAFGKIPAQAGHGDLTQSTGKIGGHLAQRDRLLVKQLGTDLRQVFCWIGQTAGEHFIQNCADGPQIGARVDLFGRNHLLGRHVQRTPHEIGSTRELEQVPSADLLRDTEVEDLDPSRSVALLREVEIRGLDIPVDDSCSMRTTDGIQGLQDPQARFLDGNPPSLFELIADIDPLEVLHHEEASTRLHRTHVEYMGHIVAPHLRGDSGFPTKSFHY